MKFTLVTTCFNEIKSFTRWKSDLIAQTRQPDEICIVDAESTDGTRECLKEWAENDPRIRVIFKKCSVARGRNLAIEMATYEYIVSTDMGVRLDRKWCEELLKPFENDKDIEVVAGWVLFDQSTLKSAVARLDYYINRDSGKRTKTNLVIGNNSCSYKKYIWQELNGLPEDLTYAADDAVFGRQILKAGYKIAVASGAKVFWARPNSLCDFWKEQYNYGRGSGEAAIIPPYAFRLYKKGLLPRYLVSFINGLRFLHKAIRLSLINEIFSNHDIKAFLILPLYLFGKGYYYGKGYLLGDEYGRKYCKDCRNRLSN